MKLFEEFCSTLDEMKLNYKSMADQNGTDIVSLGLQGDNYSGLYVYIIFDDRSVQIKCLEICKFPEDKNLIMLQTANKLNCDYRWVKFTAEPSGKLGASIDFEIDDKTSSKDAVAVISKINSIIDLAYPIIMKALYV